MHEAIVTIDSGGLPLHGVLHAPSAPAGGLVFCHPFAEEKKCAHRALVDLARACAQAGWAALLFDMRGCGDSPGDFGQFDLSQWCEDIVAALGLLRGELGVCTGLLGLRLGASMAAQVAAQQDEVACLALLEPVVKGERYVRDNLRRSLIKAMLTRREGGEDFQPDRNRPAEGGLVDFDGYPIPPTLHDQLKAIDLLAPGPRFAGPTLVLHLGSGGEVPEELAALGRTFPAGEAVAVRQEPIWQRIGLMDATPTVEAVTRWLQRL